MQAEENAIIEEAKQAARQVLLHNIHASRTGLPRTAAWGYPEPYARDLMISALGFLSDGKDEFVQATKTTLDALARNQSELGHIPSLADDPIGRGASDTTPLFLFGLAIFRRGTGQPHYLEHAAKKALTWMQYQSPDDLVMVAQLPTSDWRDEQWVLGYGLYVNTVVYAYLRLFDQHERAERLRKLTNRLDVRRDRRNHHIHEGLVVAHKPYFALYSYKSYNSERFDLLGNSLAILTGIASPSRCQELIRWIETECDALRERGDLVAELPPCLFPYIRPSDPDWRERYQQFNRPGEYHNGGVWPFVCAFYVAACVAAGRTKPARDYKVDWGFNEWHQAQTGQPLGCDWQTWSAAMYLYAAKCVERECTPFFAAVRDDEAAVEAH
jgi:hypothetical protein